MQKWGAAAFPDSLLGAKALQERDLCLEAQGPQLAALFARQLGRHFAILT